MKSSYQSSLLQILSLDFRVIAWVRLAIWRHIGVQSCHFAYCRRSITQSHNFRVLLWMNGRSIWYSSCYLFLHSVDHPKNHQWNCLLININITSSTNYFMRTMRYLSKKGDIRKASVFRSCSTIFLAEYHFVLRLRYYVNTRSNAVEYTKYEIDRHTLRNRIVRLLRPCEWQRIFENKMPLAIIYTFETVSNLWILRANTNLSKAPPHHGWTTKKSTQPNSTKLVTKMAYFREKWNANVKQEECNDENHSIPLVSVTSTYSSMRVTTKQTTYIILYQKNFIEWNYYYYLYVYIMGVSIPPIFKCYKIYSS